MNFHLGHPSLRRSTIAAIAVVAVAAVVGSTAVAVAASSRHQNSPRAIPVEAAPKTGAAASKEPCPMTLIYDPSGDANPQCTLPAVPDQIVPIKECGATPVADPSADGNPPCDFPPVNVPPVPDPGASGYACPDILMFPIDGGTVPCTVPPVTDPGSGGGDDGTISSDGSTPPGSTGPIDTTPGSSDAGAPGQGK